MPAKALKITTILFTYLVPKGWVLVAYILANSRAKIPSGVGFQIICSGEFRSQNLVA